MPAEPTQVPTFAGTSRFEVVRCLGAGGMGAVYEAFDREMQTRVALKTLLHLDSPSLLRFKNEFRSLQRMSHRSLVSLGELFEHDGNWFFTMECIDGVDILSYVGARAAVAGPQRVEEPTLPIGLDHAATREPAPGPSAIGCDLTRLRAVLPDLVGGLQALHAARKVHCDIKPSNVLVTDAGRVAILDFGLVLDFQTAGAPGLATSSTEDSFIAGTAAFMAPEQTETSTVGPAADWYAVGVLMYLALTGQLPIAGRGARLLELKRSVEPPPPRALVPSVPADLDQLCSALLRIDPDARPNGRDILLTLGCATDERPAIASEVVGDFVGREAELAFLRSAYDDVCAHGAAVTVLIDGISGLGKSALARQFAHEAPAGTVFLAGRCHERETVPYKAVDEIVDALSRQLNKVPEAEAAALVPPDAPLLARVFPVLVGCRGLASAEPAHRPANDPQEQRARVFAAWRELLARFARRQPLVIVIDDLHWADADSLRLLRDLLRRPSEPRLLFIATARTSHDALPGQRTPEELVAELGIPVRRLALTPLSAEQSRTLITRLVSGARPTALDEERLVSEAEGSPMFLQALLQYRRARAAHGPVRLDEALWAHIEQLATDRRALLELVAVAGGPVTRAVAVGAGAFDHERFAWAAAALVADRLLITSGGRLTDTIEPYHDRVRETVVAHLDATARAERHRQLARTFEEIGGADPESLAVHWRAAGERERAGRYLVKAAERAERALAFDRAARLYRDALALLPPADPDARGFRVRLGDALANAGRGGEAAEAYLAAAASDGVRDELRASEDRDLRRRGAEQLLRSGHFDQGLEVLRATLLAVGMRIPKTPGRALLSLLVRRAQRRLRGLRFERRSADQVPRETLERIDACWTASIGFGMADLVRGNDFQTRHLLLALRAGEPYRVAKALAVETGFLATVGAPGLAQTTRLLDAARAVAEETQHPHALGLAVLFDGYRAFLVGRWRECVAVMDRAEAIFRERCTGVAWEINNARLLAAWSLGYSGALETLARRLPVYVQEASDRGDLFATANLRNGLPNLVWVGQDRPSFAREQLRQAMAGWSQQGYHLQHYYHLHGATDVDLYEGDARAAHRRLVDEWPKLARSLLLRVQVVRINSLHVRGRGLLAHAASEPPASRGALLAQADRVARKLDGEQLAWASGYANLIHAGVAAGRGRPEEAMHRLHLARTFLHQSDMVLLAAAAERRLGALLGGDEGTALLARSDAFMAAEGVRNPERLTAVLAPGW